jgi:hypothetical protein
MAEVLAEVWTANARIVAGQSLSDGFALRGRLVAIITDAAWDTNAMTFQVSVDGTNYFNLYNEGAEYSIAGVTASTYRRVDMSMFYAARFLKVRSGTSAAAVAQVDDTTFTVVGWEM